MNENIKNIAKIINSKCRFQNCNDCIKSEDTCWEFETAIALDKAGYRKQLDVVKEFAEKIDLYLIKLFHQAYDSQKECEQHNGTVWENGWHRKDERMIMIHNDIKPFIRQLAEQFGNEDK